MTRTTHQLERRALHKAHRKLSNEFARAVRLQRLRLDWHETARGRCVACGTGVDHPGRQLGVRRFFFTRFFNLAPGSKSGSIHQSDPLCAMCALKVDERYRR